MGEVVTMPRTPVAKFVRIVMRESTRPPFLINQLMRRAYPSSPFAVVFLVVFGGVAIASSRPSSIMTTSPDGGGTAGGSDDDDLTAIAHPLTIGM
jgi:hypothetical protein